MNIFKTRFFDELLDFIERWYLAFIILILIAASVNLFYNLGNVPIFGWDEARHGVNAYEMIKRNDYIINTYEYHNDYWNLKPPVSYWAIAAGYKLVGFNALGLRIFSAFAALLTIITVAAFSLHRYGRLASLIASSSLTTTMPFIIDHCARTGDADSIFVLFFTIAMISMGLIEENLKWVHIAGLSFALAFLTKSWHSGNIILVGGLYLLLSGVLFKLRFRNILIFILSTTAPILIWGIFRYMEDGLTFFKSMINYDLLARTSVALEGHVGNTSYYLDILKNSYFYWFLVFVSVVISITMLLRPENLNKKLVNNILPIFLWIAIPFLLYTKAKTKIAWYILPLYPAMAIGIGAASNIFLRSRMRNIISQVLLGIMIIFTLYINEVSIVKMVLNYNVDNTQVLIKEVGKLTEYREKHIYTTYKTGSADDPNRWEQSYLLCAELYGDLIPVEGGVAGFLTDNTDKPLFLTAKDKLEQLNLDEYNLKVVVENETACILTK